MACDLAGAKPSFEPMLELRKLIGPLGTNLSEILIEIYTYLFKKMHLKISSGGHFVSTPMCQCCLIISGHMVLCYKWNSFELQLLAASFFINYMGISHNLSDVA